MNNSNYKLQIKITSILFLCMVLISCDQSNPEMAELKMDMDAMQLEEVVMTNQSTPPMEQDMQHQTMSKKIIKTGGINFESKNVKQDYEKIRAMLPKYKAYIENENQSRTERQIAYTLTVRIPSHSFDSLYSQVSSLGFRLENKYSNVEDVTEQFYDLKTRIKNKIALEKRYIKLLDKAVEIKDILEIERNLNQVRSDIEWAQGRLNYLSKQIGYSTLNLYFYETLPYVYHASQSQDFGSRVLSSLDDGWRALLTLLVVLVKLWPFLILATLGVILFRKWKKVKTQKA